MVRAGHGVTVVNHSSGTPEDWNGQMNQGQPDARRRDARLSVGVLGTGRVGAVLGAAGGGPTMLVVPEAELVSGHPRGVRSAARPAFVVSGCRGFLLGAGRRFERTRPGDLVA